MHEGPGWRRAYAGAARALVPRIGGPALLLVTGAILLRWTWMSWYDVISDSGRELYIPWQLASGKVLYRDVAHFNGPLSQYADALWFRLFGVGLRSLLAMDLLVLAAIAVLVYRGASAAVGRGTATLCGLVFLTVFAFGPLSEGGSFSYTAPYSHEMTHGALLLLLLLACVAGQVARPGLLPPALAGCLLGLLFLTKPELWVAGTAGAGTGFCLAWAARGGGARAAATDLAALLGPAAAVPCVAWALLATAMPARAALHGVLGAWPHLANPELLAMPYFRMFMGTHDLAYSLVLLLVWSLAYLALFGGIWLLARGAGALGRGGTAVLAALLCTPAAFVLGYRESIAWLDAARPLPVALALLVALEGMALARGWKDAELRPRRILFVTVGVSSCALLFKMLLHARVWHYGFVLAMPGTLLLVAYSIHLVPRALSRRGGAGGAFRAAAIALVLAGVAGHLGLIGTSLEKRRVRVGLGEETIRADARGVAVQATLEHVQRLAPPRGTLAVLPDGVLINFLTRRSNPTPFIIGNPADVAMFGEDRMLAAFRSAPPDFIALTGCDTAIYGPRFFGKDYAFELSSWIEAHYTPVALAGPPPFQGKGFGIELLRRAR